MPAELLTTGAARAGGRVQAAGRQQGQTDARKRSPANPAAQPRKQAVLRALDIHRQQRGVGLVGGQRRTFVDFHQRPGDADPSLWKHYHPFAGLEMLNQGFQIMRISRVNADVAGHGDERLDPPVPGHLGIDDKDRHIRQKRRQQRAVQIGDVIGDDQQALLIVGIVFPAAQFHPEQPLEQATGQSLQDMAHGLMHSVFGVRGVRPVPINPGF